MSHTREETLRCPCNVGDDGDECDGEVTVELEWNPGEMYGQDADGNRGVWQPGYWSAFSCSEKCSNGCELTEEQQDALMKEAESNTSEVENEPDYGDDDTYDIFSE